MRGYFIIFLLLLNVYKDADVVVNTPQVHDINIFNYFNNVNFSKYYFNNKLLRIFINSYILDLNFDNTFINYFNFYIFCHLKLFYVILNFEDFKYEEDKH
jgi:hypothetical protein